MNFRTEIAIRKMEPLIHFEDELLFIGSCFVENIGKKFQDAGFQTTINPFGTLYNPASIHQALQKLMHPKPFTTDDLFYHQGLWHSFSHHSRFSRISKTETVESINEELTEGANRLKNAKWILVTFGTTSVYREASTGHLVANCHKMPETHFVKQQLSQSEIVSSFVSLLTEWHQTNPALQWIFTVSPIRHWKDGAHENQISKATLLLTIEQLQQTFPFVHYFPAYEIMMDELRDYRFYADDMLHPSPLAIEFIWEKVLQAVIDEQAKPILNEINAIQKALNHRSFRPDSEADQLFQEKTKERIRRLQAIYPFVHFNNER